MLLSVFTRHSTTCRFSRDRACRRCNCPKWVGGQVNGYYFRQSAKTRQWAEAEEVRVKLEEALIKGLPPFGTAVATGSAPPIPTQADPPPASRTGVPEPRVPKPRPRVTVAQAVEAYLADAVSRSVESSTLKKLGTIFRKQFLAWTRVEGIEYLDELELDTLLNFRNTWEDGPLAKQKKQSRVIGFFWACVRRRYLTENPAIGLGKIKVVQIPTDYFPPDEFERIIAATYIRRGKRGGGDVKANQARLRTMTLLMRWSGLRIRDAVTLERHRLNGDSLLLYQAKTGTPVYVPLPPHVVEALESIPPGPKPNPRYFFWSGNGEQRTEQSEVMALDTHRLRMWRQKEGSGYFFENHLHVYFIWDPRIHAKLYHSVQQKRSANGFTLSQRKAIQRTRKEHETFLAEFESILRGIEGSMEAAGLGPRRLSTQDLFEEVKHAQHPIRRDRRPYVPGEEMVEYRSAREQATEASILNETETYLNIDGYLYAVVSLKELPDATFPGMLKNFSTLGFPVVISGQVVIPDQVKVLKSYKKRLQKMTAAQKDANGNFKSNPEAEVAQAQLIQVQRDIISSSLKTAKLSLSVVVRTSQPAITLRDLEKSERELANRTQEVLNAFTHMNGAKAVAETIAKRRIFLGTLPGMAEADKRDQDMLTSNVADLVPVEMPWTGTRRSPLILFETPYRQLIPFSMFDPDLSDANGLLMAKSGGGKTLAAQQMLLMAARANPLISLLERGDSYQPLVELLGGEMIEMSLDSDQTINPWDLPRGEDRPSNDQISFLKNLTRHMLGENTPPDLDIDLLDSVLLEAIASTYKRCSAKTSNPIPLFGDLAAELAHWQDRDRNQKINAMAQMASTKLRAWVDEGPYARLFDRPTTVQLNNPWLYFNVEKLKDDPRLERAMSLLIAHTATYRASGITGQPSIVLLDECWALLESPILAGVVVQLFRTARKRNASVWGISQTPEDFVGTPDRPNEHGAGIVKNATTKIIGKQPGDMTALREHVHLNETALNQIKTFAHPKKGHSAEFLIAIGEKAESTHAIRVVPSPVDYWITTTYARERAFRRWWLREQRRLPLIEAYEELAAQYPRGLAELAPLPGGSMCNVRMIRTEPGLVSIPLEKAVYCENCTMVSSSARQRCGLCGSSDWLP